MIGSDKSSDTRVTRHTTRLEMVETHLLRSFRLDGTFGDVVEPFILDVVEKALLLKAKDESRDGYTVAFVT